MLYRTLSVKRVSQQHELCMIGLFKSQAPDLHSVPALSLSDRQVPGTALTNLARRFH